ncbi:unnamed protein product [Chondrus crispus]|uniref:Uncharacterized protein n=1 Tax=Chondrus crispus TaxID=2769 RepID=R7QUV2_CHOCR|nr:unnamed protein product [Chondrus crispus]CDF41261.1 unnamed protein product [Chondrus crispus]|eukprot:XP_005711555.1 unnamed protein product [Chondrus crispus]
MHPRKTGDILLDDFEDVAPVAPVARPDPTPKAPPPPPSPPENGHLHQSLRDLDLYPNHPHHPLDDPLALQSPHPLATTDEQEQEHLLGLHPHQPQDVLLVDQDPPKEEEEEEEEEEKEEEEEEEDMIDLVEKEEKPVVPPAPDDQVIEVAPDGKEIVPQLPEKKPPSGKKPPPEKNPPSLTNYYSRLHSAKEETTRKKIHIVPIGDITPLEGLPPAQDTAFAKRERLKEKMAMRSAKGKQAKQSKKAQEARELERRRMLAERKKKKAATSKEEPIILDDEEDRVQPDAEAAPASAIHPENGESSTVPAQNSRPRSPNRIPHHSRKRQRLLRPDAPHAQNGHAPPFPQDPPFHSPAPPYAWPQGKQPPPHGAPNGGAPNGSYPSSFPPPGRDPVPPYPHDRFPQSYPHYPPHPHPQYPHPPPPQGPMPYGSHSQYPPPPYGAPYPNQGYPPHGQPPTYPMYNHHQQQYGAPPYGGPAQAPFRPPAQFAKRERLPEPLFAQKRKQLYNTIGAERKDLSPDDERIIDDFLDNQIYMFRPEEEQKDLLLDLRPGTRTILRIHKNDGVWSVVKLRD